MSLVAMGNYTAPALTESQQLVSDLFHQLSQPLTTLCCALELALLQTPYPRTIWRDRKPGAGPGGESLRAGNRHPGAIWRRPAGRERRPAGAAAGGRRGHRRPAAGGGIGGRAGLLCARTCVSGVVRRLPPAARPVPPGRLCDWLGRSGRHRTGGASSASHAGADDFWPRRRRRYARRPRPGTLAALGTGDRARHL